LDDPRAHRFVSGQFFAFNRNVDHERKQELCVDVELAPGVKPHKSISAAIKKSIVDKLIAQNIEYRKLYSTLRDRALPKLGVVPFGKKNFAHQNVRGLVGINGKKVKMFETS
jgi:hypothetical protein